MVFHPSHGSTDYAGQNKDLVCPVLDLTPHLPTDLRRDGFEHRRIICAQPRRPSDVRPVDQGRRCGERKENAVREWRRRASIAQLPSYFNHGILHFCDDANNATIPTRLRGRHSPVCCAFKCRTVTKCHSCSCKIKCRADRSMVLQIGAYTVRTRGGVQVCAACALRGSKDDMGPLRRLSPLTCLTRASPRLTLQTGQGYTAGLSSIAYRRRQCLHSEGV